jgi:hypothetical protein
LPENCTQTTLVNYNTHWHKQEALKISSTPFCLAGFCDPQGAYLPFVTAKALLASIRYRLAYPCLQTLTPLMIESGLKKD